jgi:hypothetical protein
MRKETPYFSVGRTLFISLIKIILITFIIDYIKIILITFIIDYINIDN